MMLNCIWQAYTVSPVKKNFRPNLNMWHTLATKFPYVDNLWCVAFQFNACACVCVWIRIVSMLSAYNTRINTIKMEFQGNNSIVYIIRSFSLSLFL